MPKKTLEELKKEAEELEELQRINAAELEQAKANHIQGLRDEAEELRGMATRLEVEAREAREKASRLNGKADALEGKPQKRPRGPVKPKPTPSEVHNALKLHGPQSCAELAVRAGWGKAAVQDILWGLEVDKSVVKDGTGRWTKWSAV